MPKLLYVLCCYAIVMGALSLSEVSCFAANPTENIVGNMIYLVIYPLLTTGIFLKKNIARQAYILVTSILIAWTVIGTLSAFFITLPSEIPENIGALGTAVGMGPGILLLMVYAAIHLLLIQIACSKQVVQYTKQARYNKSL